MADESIIQGQPKRVPIDEELLTMPLFPTEQVRLRGSKCRNCREVFFGKLLGCENCGSKDIEDIPLSRRGKLYTYTVVRHRPAGDYKGPDPFVPGDRNCGGLVHGRYLCGCHPCRIG